MSRRRAAVLGAVLTIASCRKSPTPVVAPRDGGAAAAASLRGRVEDRTHKPVTGARVLAWARDGWSANARVAQTNAQGDFALDGLPPGPVMVFAEAPGLGTMERNDQTAPAAEVRLTLPGESLSVGGVVTRDGTASPGARVRIGGPEMPEPRITTADANGHFHLTGLGAGRYTLRADAPGAASAPRTLILADRPLDVQLVLAAATTVTGRVVDGRGKAVRDVDVRMAQLPADDCPARVRTDVVGFFDFGSTPPGSYAVTAQQPGSALAGTPVVRVNGAPVDVLLRLLPSARLDGRVVDEAGHAVAAAVVTLLGTRAPRDQLTVLTGALPYAAEAAALPGAGLPSRPAGAERSVSTDAAGRFTFTDVAPGERSLDVAHPQYLAVVGHPVRLEAGERTQVGDLRLSHGVVLRGTVLSTADTPATGARVLARAWQDGDQGRATIVAGARFTLSTLSAGDGSFSLRLPLGRYAVVASMQAGPESPASALAVLPSLTLTANRSEVPVTLRLEPASRRLSGQVTDPTGRPVAGAVVTARTLPGEIALGRTRTTARGAFVLAGLPPTDLSVEVAHPAWATAQHEALAGNPGPLHVGLGPPVTAAK